MQLKWKQAVLTGALSLLLTSAGSAQGPARGRRGAPERVPAGVYTNISGTIAQLNYNRDAMPAGFVLTDKTLVHLAPNAAALLGSGLRPGDTVEIGGLANTSASGFKTVEAQQVKDRTSGKSFTLPQPGPAAPYSGSGRIQQLNYGPEGAVNGFLLDNGTLATLPPFAEANPSSIRPGAAVSFTGYARATLAGRTAVDLQTLSINGQTLSVAGAGPRLGVGAPPQAAGAPEGPGVAGGAGAPAAQGRTEQPPPPPPPPAAPQGPGVAPGAAPAASAPAAQGVNPRP